MIWSEHTNICFILWHSQNTFTFVPFYDMIRTHSHFFFNMIWTLIFVLFYDLIRTNMLLEDVCDAVGLPYFCTCVWECVLSCPNARLSGTLFLLNHLRKLHSLQDQLLMIGLNTEVMVCIKMYMIEQQLWLYSRLNPLILKSCCIMPRGYFVIHIKLTFAGSGELCGLETVTRDRRL